jgi:ferredoxin
MKRDIVEIDEERCNGCGACATACHEGAIQMMSGKAHLVSEIYCDGLGACLPHCPTGAITVVQKESAAFDEKAVKTHLQAKPASVMHISQPAGNGHVCPGSAARQMQPARHTMPISVAVDDESVDSELSQWPVQMKLINVRAPYFQNCDLLVAADCSAFAYARFHADFICNHITVIGCPKLDDNSYYIDKLTELLALNDIHSITVVRMEVPCCSGITEAVKRAMLTNGKILPYREVVLSVEGNILI